MGIADLPILAALRDKMHWHQSRQSVLAENVANAETPGYRGRDLTPYRFENQLRRVEVASVSADPRHIPFGGGSGDRFRAGQLNSFEITPDGNGVSLEAEMMKVTTNQMDYQAVTTLYTRSMRLMRIALGKQG